MRKTLPHNTPNNAAVLGEIVYLMSLSPLHESWSLKSIHQWVLPALKHQQYRLYHSGGKPVGFVSWAFLSREAETRYVNNSRSLHPDDWNSGELMWFLDLIAPDGAGKAIIKDLKNNLFPNEVARALRWRKGSDTMSIFYLHGKNALKKAQDRNQSPTVAL